MAHVSHFREKRLMGKDRVIGIEGTNIMIIDNEVRTRGIKRWEIEKYNNDMARMRNNAYFKSIEDAKRLKYKQMNNITKGKCSHHDENKNTSEPEFVFDSSENLKMNKQFNDEIVYSGNDAWDD